MNRMRVLSSAAALFIFCLALPHRAAAQSCEHEAQRSGTAAMAGVDHVRVIAHAGSLEVYGRDGVSEASARGRACASDADDLRELTLQVRRDGSTLVIEVNDPDDHGIDWDDDYAYLDLVVNLPAGVAVSIEDGSGEMRVAGVGPLRVNDGSGSMEIRDIRGGADIEDGSGEIELSNIGGDVDIEDGSGEITISGVRGGVEIEDGSGEIRVADVDRSVRVDDGSGSIRVERIGGDFIVDDGGSGDVSYASVTGRVRVPDDD